MTTTRPTGVACPDCGAKGACAECQGMGSLTTGAPCPRQCHDGDCPTCGGYGLIAISITEAEKSIDRLRAEITRLKADQTALLRDRHEIEQVLGRALGYPRYADDPANFPDATEADGVCTGPHTAVTLADEVAEEVARFKADLARVTAERDKLIDWHISRDRDEPDKYAAHLNDGWMTMPIAYEAAIAEVRKAAGLDAGEEGGNG